MVPRKIIRILLLSLFILFQVFLLFFKEIDVQAVSPYLNQHPLPLFGENKTLSQEFRCPGPLIRIDVMLANYLKKPKGGTLNLTIFHKDKTIFNKDYPANTAEDNRFYRFRISTHKKIPRGRYRLQLSFSRVAETDKLAVWISTQNLYRYGRLYADGVRREGDMTFRVYYGSTIWKERDRWLKNIPEFPARAYIMGGGFFLLLFMVNLLLYLLLKLPEQDEHKIDGSSETH